MKRVLMIAVIAAVAAPALTPAEKIESLVYYEPDPEFTVYYCESFQIAKHFAYTVSYNEKFEQANWVSYRLTKEMLDNPVCTRKDRFRMDPFIVTGSAASSDYDDPNYVQGHLAPCADMLCSDVAMDESFFMSNISPQTKDFNNKIWKKLEEQVRDWADAYEELYVVVGPVLDENTFPTIGRRNVAVPERFFKVLLDNKGPDIKAIGFIIPQEEHDGDFRDFAVSVDEVEQVTAFDFFYSLPNSVEDAIEASDQYWQ